LTQEALAHKAGFSVSYVSMLERSQHSPSLPTIDLIAKVLKTRPVYMLQRNEIPKLNSERRRL
jgi:transcriptional regulator with XRE-family HTH domain